MLVTIFPFICVKSMTFGMDSTSWKGMSCSEKHSYWRVLIGGYMTYLIVKAAHSLIVSLFPSRFLPTLNTLMKAASL